MDENVDDKYTVTPLQTPEENSLYSFFPILATVILFAGLMFGFGVFLGRAFVMVTGIGSIAIFEPIFGVVVLGASITLLLHDNFFEIPMTRY